MHERTTSSFVSKDEDFSELPVLRGLPKVVWLRLGNCSTVAVEQLLRRNVAVIADFATDTERLVLELHE